MTHYDIVEWKLFNEDLLNKDIKKDMEDHLLECDHCMDLFLSLIDGELEDTPKITEDFTDNVIKNLAKVAFVGNRAKNNKKRPKTYNELVVYYMAVASVAIFLTASGFFTSIVSQAPEFGENFIRSKKEVRIDLVYNFSRSITDTTSSFVRDFNLELKEKR